MYGWAFIMVSVAVIFGAETVVAGILGIFAGSFLGQKLRRIYPTADPIVCGVGLLASAPLMLETLILASGPSAITTFVVMFFGQLFLNLNWSLVADITLVNNLKILSVTFWASCHDCVHLSSNQCLPHALPVNRVVISIFVLFLFDFCILAYRTFSA
jgi:hypothetical protein